MVKYVVDWELSPWVFIKNLEWVVRFIDCNIRNTDQIERWVRFHGEWYIESMERLITNIELIAINLLYNYIDMIETIVYMLLILNILIIIWMVMIYFRINNVQKTDVTKELADFRLSINEYISNKFTEFFRENKENEKNLRESTEKFLKNTDDNIKSNLENMIRSLREKFDDLNANTKDKLESISDRVDRKLEKGFEKTNETFARIIERMSKIDQAQKNIEKLSGEVVWLQRILNDSKSRGIFGEVQLDSILANVFGDNNNKLYEMQYHFVETNVIVDCVIRTPIWLIPIDAKFPLINYQKMYDDNIGLDEREQARKLFRSWVKKQIDDIGSKYIIEWKTTSSAFMFVPAEAVFSELHTNHFDLVEYAHSKSVNIVSPTTIMAMMTIILSAHRSMETHKQAQIIQIELGKLSTEFGRFKDRWWKFTKDFDKVWKDIKDIDMTNDKIMKKFDSIESLEFTEEKAILGGV